MIISMIKLGDFYNEVANKKVGQQLNAYYLLAHLKTK